MSSVHIAPPSSSAPPPPPLSSSGSDTDSDSDQEWDDWVSDSADAQRCQSLFELDKTFGSVEETLKYEKEEKGFDLESFCTSLGLDVYGRMRLINFIRRTKPKVEDVLQMTKENEVFADDGWLVPVIEDDPLLRIQTGDWTDSDAEEEGEDPSSSGQDLQKKIKLLEKQLARTNASFTQYREMVQKVQEVDVTSLRTDEVEEKKRDDDTQYFESYAENDIHCVMISDKIRTSTYASFISSTPELFEGAVVLDVGCGTGILSMFAAQAGAKKVYAVDASDIADKAREIIKTNGLENVIEVIKGKVEEVVIPEQVDVIVSEWMGYALLYESMLDSVLVARDKFLKKEGGVITPSQTKMVLALVDAQEIIKERIDFWEDVYGFNMSTMAQPLYGESIIDVLSPSSLLSETAVVKDLHIPNVNLSTLQSFSTPFVLPCTPAPKRTKASAFVLYFDTFFHPKGIKVEENVQVKVVKPNVDVQVAEVWPVGGKPAPLRRASTNKGKKGEKDGVVSFSTGPQSEPTHWKQAIFVLREAFFVTEDSIVKGIFKCRKSDTNSRELDVEIHYQVFESLEASVKEENTKDVVVQMYKVR